MEVSPEERRRGEERRESISQCPHDCDWIQEATTHICLQDCMPHKFGIIYFELILCPGFIILFPHHYTHSLPSSFSSFRSSGMKLWNQMLKFGASKSPQEILEDVGNGPLDPSHLIKEL
jgi:hypothetical protein